MVVLVEKFMFRLKLLGEEKSFHLFRLLFSTKRKVHFGGDFKYEKSWPDFFLVFNGKVRKYLEVFERIKTI